MRGTQFAELSAFVAVAEHRSFTKAAAQLSISRAGLSQIIRSLEERLGVRLLNRTTRSVALTEAGERLLNDTQPVLVGIQRAIEGVNAFRDKPSGALRLNMQRAAAVWLVGPVLPKFLAKFPDINLEIAADNNHTDIVSGRFDAGITRGEWIAKDMIVVPLLDPQRVTVVASPAYLASHPPPVSRKISSYTTVCACAWIGMPRFSPGSSRKTDGGPRWRSTVRLYSTIGTSC